MHTTSHMPMRTGTAIIRTPDGRGCLVRRQRPGRSTERRSAIAEQLGG